MPFPNQRVIPDRYAAHHRPTVESAMRSTCTVTSPAGPRPYGSAPTASTPALYTGACDVQRSPTGDSDAVQAEQEQSVADYQVTFPVADLPGLTVGERGSLIRITAADDPQLVGRTFRAASVVYGSHPFERAVMCVDNQTQNMPGGAS